MQHAEKRHNVWFAVLTVPADVRHVIGKSRFFQTTKTGSPTEAAPRVALLVALWQAEIKKARRSLPDPKAGFWETLRNDLIDANQQGDHSTEVVIFELAEEEAAEASRSGRRGSRLFRLVC